MIGPRPVAVALIFSAQKISPSIEVDISTFMSSATNIHRVRMIVFGDVQVVGFRFSCIEVARGLGLTGWVRNNPDGSVEIAAEGEREKLENLISWAKKGPPFAKVAKIQFDWEEGTGEFSGFDVRY